MKIERVPIRLDKIRYLVYDLSAFYEMEQRYGSFTSAVKNLKVEEIEDAAFMLYLGLLREDESISLDDADRLIDVTNRLFVIERILRAISASFPDADPEQTAVEQTSIPQNEKWDWAWLYYMGTVLLQMPEAVFWRCTPRKLFALWKVHKRYHGLDKEEAAQAAVPPGFIDQFI